MTNTHLMIDLETMGTRPDAPIMSIGAAFFDPNSGTVGREYYRRVDLESNMSDRRMPDADTITWWMGQSDEAREEMTNPRDRITLRAMLTELRDFVGDTPDLRVWSNGAAFDIVMLEDAYRSIGVGAPWKFWQVRDVRTIVEIGEAIGINPKRDLPFRGEKHNALSDTLHQIRYVSHIWQMLTVVYK